MVRKSGRPPSSGARSPTEQVGETPIEPSEPYRGLEGPSGPYLMGSLPALVCGKWAPGSPILRTWRVGQSWEELHEYILVAIFVSIRPVPAL